jgi:hypothetical protein
MAAAAAPLEPLVAPPAAPLTVHATTMAAAAAPLEPLVAPPAPLVAPFAPIVAPPVVDAPEKSRSAARAASRPAADEMRKSADIDRPPRPQRSKAAAGVAAATAAVRGNARATASDPTHR